MHIGACHGAPPNAMVLRPTPVDGPLRASAHTGGVALSNGAGVGLSEVRSVWNLLMTEVYPVSLFLPAGNPNMW
jgi:hypothetical protein|eukprot:COSAG01_NODE_8240_length_2857_cov_2.810145_1_plen_74_part_00